MNYSLIVAPLSDEEGGGYVGFFPDLPGCISDGETREEAARNAEDALVAWLEVQSERGAQLPEAGAASVEAEEEREQMVHAIARLTTELEGARERIEELEEASSGWPAPKAHRRSHGGRPMTFRPMDAVA